MSDKPDEKSHQAFLDSMKKILEQASFFKEVKPEPAQESTEETPTAQTRTHKLRFDLKPKEIKKYLDRFVIKQDEAKRILATAVCDHYNHVRREESGQKAAAYAKQNILLLGPTGVGKTHLIRHLAELIGVPFVKADATKFSETGYVGGDVEDLIRELVQKAQGDVALAQYGMIYLDEIDKIASQTGLTGRDVSGSGVQRNLLKLMEETEVPLRSQQDIQAQLQAMVDFQKNGKVTKPNISTRHILFIVSGAFDGLAAIIEARLRQAQIGFNASQKAATADSVLFRRAQTEDFTRFGFESEFIGRLPVRAVCEPLTEEDLYQILAHSEDSVLKQHAASFQAYGVDMRIENKALWEIAKLALLEKTGARGLLTVCEKIFRDLKFELPSSRIKTFTLAPALVHQTADTLRDILKEERAEREREIEREIRSFEASFYEKTSQRILFDPAATQALVRRILAEDLETTAHLQQLLANYDYGLGLVQQKKPRELFLLPQDVCANPNALLDRWIKDAYEPV